MNTEQRLSERIKSATRKGEQQERHRDMQRYRETHTHIFETEPEIGDKRDTERTRVD